MNPRAAKGATHKTHNHDVIFNPNFSLNKKYTTTARAIPIIDEKNCLIDNPKKTLSV